MRRAPALLAALALAGCGADEPAAPNVIEGEPVATTTAAPATTTAAMPGRGAPGSDPTRTTPAGPSRGQLRGGRVLFPFAGRRAPRALLRRLRTGRAAGVILLGRNLGTPEQVRALTRSLRAAARAGGHPAPLIAVDQEGGTVKRLPGAPRRDAPALGRLGRADVARREGRATARTLRAAGVNVDFAPVADVVRPGSALERERRGFGADPALVTRLARGFSEGLADGGVAATLKHFPGFGAAKGNTDDAPQRIDLSRSRLRSIDMAPFAAVDAPLVMLSSAVYPALSARPAVLSRAIVTGELRERLRFAGVTVSDDLETPALAGRDAAVGAARAGVDLLLFARSYRAAARAAERVPADRAAHARITALREALR